VASERRQLPAVRRLVEREYDELKARVIPIRVEQWAQVARELGRHRYVSPAIRSETPIHQLVVIAQRARVELHHEPIVHRQARHLHEEMRLEACLVFRVRRTFAGLGEQALRLRILEPFGAWNDDGVIRRGRAHRLELSASPRERIHQLRATSDRAATDAPQTA